MFEWIYVDACDLYTEVPSHGSMTNIINPYEFSKVLFVPGLVGSFQPKIQAEVDFA